MVNITLNTIKKALILTLGAFLLFIGVAVRVRAEKLYVLENRVENGDFADGVSPFYATNTAPVTPDVVNERCVATSNGLSYYAGIQQNETISNAHFYYYSFNIFTNSTTAIDYSFSFRGTSTQSIKRSTAPSIATIITGVVLSTSTNTYFTLFLASKNNIDLLPSSVYLNADNVIIIDLTSAFGSGFEPSLTDFEALYLPDLDYFETYESYMPESYIFLTASDYTNLTTDLTSLDYTKSVIDTYGDNMTVDVSVYLTDWVSGHADQAGIADDYIENNHPTIQYLGITDALSWELSDYSAYVVDLAMTDEQEERLKRVLFDRSISEADGFFMIECRDYSTYNYLGVNLWITIGSAFDLKVDINSIVISQKMETGNVFNIEQVMYMKAFDPRGNLLLPALSVTFGDTLRTSLFDDFGSQYTDVGKFSLEFDMWTPDSGDAPDEPWEDFYLYEIGVFSASNIIQPSAPEDGEIGFIFASETCEWYELGCQAKNGINEISQDIYLALRIDEIIATIQDIIDSVSVVVAILPSEWGTILAIILSGVGVAIVIVIIDKITGGGGSA